MIIAENGDAVYQNKIEALFYQYCLDNNIDTKKRNINDSDATCIWRYIYNCLFKPAPGEKLGQNKNSTIDYSDIETIYNILYIFLDLCYQFKVLPLVCDFSILTGISVETLNCWKKGEKRASKQDINATHKYRDIVKNIEESAKNMILKDLHQTPIGIQSLANNADEVGLRFASKQAAAEAQAWMLPVEAPLQIAKRHGGGGKKSLPKFE